MKLSIWKVAVLMLASAAMAAAVVGTAVGGSSVKSIVKKEVTKQLKNKTGPAGPAGPEGKTGPSGSSNVTVVRKQLDVANNSNDSDFAECPQGQRATGGGVGPDGGGSFVNGDKLIDSQPTIGTTFNPVNGSVATAWFGQAATTGTGFTAHVYVLCVPNP